VALQTATIRVSGIRCERCVHRLGSVLRGHGGLAAASANLVGEVTLSWDDELTGLDTLLEEMAEAGFRTQAPAAPA